MHNFVIIMIGAKNGIFGVSIKSVFLEKMNVGCYSAYLSVWGRMILLICFKSPGCCFD